MAAILFPADAAGLLLIPLLFYGARDNLIERANAAGIEAIVLSPVLGDFNEDLRTFGIDALRAAVRQQLAPEDVARFLALAA